MDAKTFNNDLNVLVHQTMKDGKTDAATIIGILEITKLNLDHRMRALMHQTKVSGIMRANFPPPAPPSLAPED